MRMAADFKPFSRGHGLGAVALWTMPRFFALPPFPASGGGNFADHRVPGFRAWRPGPSQFAGGLSQVAAPTQGLQVPKVVGIALPVARHVVTLEAARLAAFAAAVAVTVKDGPPRPCPLAPVQLTVASAHGKRRGLCLRTSKRRDHAPAVPNASTLKRGPRTRIAPDGQTQVQPAPPQSRQPTGGQCAPGPSHGQGRGSRSRHVEALTWLWP